MLQSSACLQISLQHNQLLFFISHSLFIFLLLFSFRNILRVFLLFITKLWRFIVLVFHCVLGCFSLIFNMKIVKKIPIGWINFHSFLLRKTTSFFLMFEHLILYIDYFSFYQSVSHCDHDWNRLYFDMISILEQEQLRPILYHFNYRWHL